MPAGDAAGDTTAVAAVIQVGVTTEGAAGAVVAADGAAAIRAAIAVAILAVT